MKEFRKRHPNAETDEQFENWLKAKIQQRQQSNQTDEVVYTIPIIFHIVHESNEAPGIGRNIAKNRIDSQIVQLNRDFANLSGSQISVAADIKIQFCPALVDTNGNILPEPGIDRIDRNSKGWNAPPYDGDQTFSYVDATIMPQSIWNPDRYLNVWILDLAGSLFGKATYPVSSGLPGLFVLNPDRDDHSGVFIYYKCVGSIHNQGDYNTIKGMGHVLTHETGHFLGLKHIWGNDSSDICNLFPNLFLCPCQTTDYCDDTPPQRNPTSGCPAGSSDPQYLQNCPNPGEGGKRMFENYMDYTDDICLNTFTQDQKLRMRTVMENSPRRANLISSNVCCPMADLTIIAPDVSSPSIIAGTTVTVYFAENNEGYGTAVPNYVSFHLSPDDVLTPGENGDIYIGEYYVNQTLSPLSQTILLNQQLTIPLSVAPGTYYLFFSADGSGLVNECIEDNNFATAIITVSDAPSPSQALYRYWFDDKFGNSISVNTSSGNNHYNIQRLVSTSLLQQGLHTLNFQFKDINDKWSSIISSFFYKLNVTPPAGTARYEYWFDNDYINKTTNNISSTNNFILLNDITVNTLNEGLHTLHIRFRPDGRAWSSVVSSFFYKPVFTSPTGTAQYEYWFDNDYQGKTQLNNISTNNFILLNDIPVNTLNEGLHTLHIRFLPDGRTWSSIVSSFFYKTNNSPTGPAEYEYWFDSDYANKVTPGISNTNNFILLDNIITSSINNGLHTLNVRFRPDGKKWSSVTTSFFYKDNDALFPINNLAKFVYWYDNNWQVPKTISIIGTQNINWTLNTDAAELSEGRHNLSMSFKDDRGKWSSIVSDSFTKVPITAQTCLEGNRQFISGIIAGNGSTYQWQLDSGTGFANISNNAIYSGTNDDTLVLTNAPTSWYGYKYRCLVTNGANTLTGETNILKFVTTWNGSADNAWENPANWSCNALPDANTDVYINAGMPRYVEINSNASCRRLNLQPGTSLEVKPGKNLDITGKDQ